MMEEECNDECLRTISVMEVKYNDMIEDNKCDGGEYNDT